jgi:hypothetical protein
MRNGGLGKMNALLDIRCAQAHVLANGTSAVLLQGLQNPPAGGISDGIQDAIQVLLCQAHDLGIDCESTVVNLGLVLPMRPGLDRAKTLRSPSE